MILFQFPVKKAIVVNKFSPKNGISKLFFHRTKRKDFYFNNLEFFVSFMYFLLLKKL
jgi:hypothetical protein